MKYPNGNLPASKKFMPIKRIRKSGHFIVDFESGYTTYFGVEFILLYSLFQITNGLDNAVFD